MPTNIAHISDIHFKVSPNQIGHDPNEQMRDEMIRDLEKKVAEWGKLDAIIVSGDIAFAGRKDEFSLAKEWLKEILSRTNSHDAKIIVCPGNHDIDRSVLKAQPLIEDGHSAIRASPTNVKRESELLRRLGVEATRDLFYRALENYNDFSQQYNCSFYATKENYSWHHDLLLDDGSKLRIRGLNSTTLCGQQDVKGQLYIGRAAWNLKREDGIEYLVFAHHPPSWLLDGSEMVNELDDRAAIQLYGHEHKARISQSGSSIVMYAGAVNPVRDEGDWLPGFNFIRISVTNDNSTRKMLVKIFSREWQEQNPSQFKDYKGKGQDGSHEYTKNLEKWSPPSVDNVPEPFVSPLPKATQINSSINTNISVAAQVQKSESEILSEFYDMQFSEQYDIVRNLGLLREEDKGFPQFMQIKRALIFAKSQNRISQLLNEK
ncbi:metallophosphoesterase [Burkholderia sp. LMU1-1-1.1]|uniref:metallophosphoesterase n=1 Tax=Burkholderia sp. LMU1-1-1.1 TaxID=3135266 RepID=UPI0034226C82